jgi:glutathione synthase/RimK-type ligase-like ATP-grasp enzyme
MRRSCAFLTMHSLDGFVTDDHLVHAPLAAAGWTLQYIPWRQKGIDWSRYDLVLIRSTWDYHRDADAFLAVLAEIHRSGTCLQNDLDLVTWNLRKTYLHDLEAAGIPIVPTRWGEGLDMDRLDRLFDTLDAGEIVVKPVVSAGAHDTFRLPRHAPRDTLAQVADTFAQRPFMAQPFLDAIVQEGEYSVFFFGGSHSHTVVKRPKTGDFRVQEEHGGQLCAVAPEARLLSQANAVVESLRQPPLYARVDLVRGSDGRFLLMEIELIEPSLYFRISPGSPARFVQALERWMQGGIGRP